MICAVKKLWWRACRVFLSSAAHPRCVVCSLVCPVQRVLLLFAASRFEKKQKNSCVVFWGVVAVKKYRELLSRFLLFILFFIFYLLFILFFYFFKCTGVSRTVGATSSISRGARVSCLGGLFASARNAVRVHHRVLRRWAYTSSASKELFGTPNVELSISVHLLGSSLFKGLTCHLWCFNLGTLACRRAGCVCPAS